MKPVLLLLFAVFSLSLNAQNSISGKVTDKNNNPIPYVNIVIENTSEGTISDAEGKFLFADLQPGEYTLVFSSIGFETEKVTVNLSGSEEEEITVQLQTGQQDLGEVMITTYRTAETLDEVPSSVSVLSSREIETYAKTSTSVADILMRVPGLALSTNQTSNTGQTLRGRNMLILIDGIPQSTPLRSGGRDVNTIDPNTLQRIEIIKGATAIYGNGADGGIINYITKDPAPNQELKSTTEIGTSGSLVELAHTVGSEVSQTFSGTIGNLGYVASGSFRQTGIFRDANGVVVAPYYGLGETDQYSLFGKLQYRFSEDHSIEMMYNYYSSNQDTEYITQNGVYMERPAIGVIGEVLGVDQGNRHNHNAQLTYRADDLIGNTDFRANLYMQDFLTVYGFSPYFYNADAGYVGGQSTVASDKSGARFNFKTPYSFGEDFGGDILYGIDILNDVTSQKLVDGRIWAPEMDMTNFAPYAQVKTIYEDLVFKAGIRFENINIEVPDYSTIFLFPYGQETSSGGVSVNGGEIKYDATTFNAGLRYNEWNFFQPFISFSQSFSIADLGRTLRTATENTVANINSEAVIANNYEIGFNSRLGNTKLTGAYFISTSELGATYREVNGIFQIARQPEKIYGFELALDTELTENLFFGSSVSYVEGKVDSDNNDSYDTYINGDRIPPVKTVTYLQYTLWDKLNTRLSHIYSGNRDRFSPNAEGLYAYGQGPVNSFNLVNFSAGYELTPTTEIGLGIQNLLNEDYYNLGSMWKARDSGYIKGYGARYSLSLKVTL